MTSEPLLALDDIQGLVVPGLLRRHQVLMCLSLRVTGLRPFCDALLRLIDAGRIPSGSQVLKERRTFRETGLVTEPRIGVAWTATGLNMLCDKLSTTVPSPAFQAGMAARGGLLGDDAPLAADGAKKPVDPPWPQAALMLVITGASSAAVATVADELRALLANGNTRARVVHEQRGDALGTSPQGNREHFGFADGMSQPGLRGLSAAKPPVHLTRRRLPRTDPEHDLFGLPGQDLVWPGEFVLGYPASSPDPRLPGPVRPVPAWMHDGSFLVYRRLRQHVGNFRALMQAQAAVLTATTGFGAVTPERLAALLVGRWPSGAPVLRTPDADDPDLAHPLVANDFRFDDDAPKRNHQRVDRRGLPRATTDLGKLPTAQADPLGLVCPMASHIRKVNLRDQASDMGGASATQQRRLLRIGVPYGAPLPEGQDDSDQDDRGLLFLSLQASIEDQFEFLQARWMNSAVRPRGLGGHDMLVGQPAGGVRQCTLFGPDQVPVTVKFDKPFVTLTGGDYFFVPSLPTLRALLTGAPLPDGRTSPGASS